MVRNTLIPPLFISDEACANMMAYYPEHTPFWFLIAEYKGSRYADGPWAGPPSKVFADMAYRIKVTFKGKENV